MEAAFSYMRPFRRRPGIPRRRPGSDIEEEMTDITILDDVLFPVQLHLARLLDGLLGAGGHEIIVLHHLDPDETTFEIAVDDTGGLRGERAFRDRPGACLLGPGGEIGLKLQKLVARPDHPVEPGLVEAQFLQEHLGLFQVELRDLLLDLGGDHHMRRALRLGPAPYLSDRQLDDAIGILGEVVRGLA